MIKGEVGLSSGAAGEIGATSADVVTHSPGLLPPGVTAVRGS